jgi:enamine deaminase RidA (YjgF/YER057c/UK114 family)
VTQAAGVTVCDMTTTHTGPAPVTSINPSTFAVEHFRYDLAQERPFPTRLLTLAGQAAVGVDGAVVPGGTGPQLAQAMRNVEDLLARGGMDLRDVISMTIHVTDIDAAMAAYGNVVERLDTVGATPPCTLVEVSRLALPDMTVEITAAAGR